MRKLFRICLWIVMLIFSTACKGVFSPSLQSKTVCGEIEITGTMDFTTQTCAALALLEQKDPESFQKIQIYIGAIKQGEHSGMWVWETPPRYEVGDTTAFSSLTWYASTIAHEATHSELYTEYHLAHPGASVPDEVFSGVDVERFCNAYQLEVLKNIGGPQNEIDYMGTLDGTHCDLDDDGDCDIADYQMRNW